MSEGHAPSLRAKRGCRECGTSRCHFSQLISHRRGVSATAIGDQLVKPDREFPHSELDSLPQPCQRLRHPGPRVDAADVVKVHEAHADLLAIFGIDAGDAEPAAVATGLHF